MGTTYISVSATNYVVHTAVALIAGAIAGAGVALAISNAKGTDFTTEFAKKKMVKA